MGEEEEREEEEREEEEREEEERRRWGGGEGRVGRRKIVCVWVHGEQYYCVYDK